VTRKQPGGTGSSSPSPRPSAPTSPPPDWLRVLVTGWPEVASLAGTLLAHTASTPDVSAPDSVDVVDNRDGRDAHPTPEPVEPVTLSEPVRAAAPERPAVSVPAALVEHTRPR
jgi:hypothetical protein